MEEEREPCGTAEQSETVKSPYRGLWGKLDEFFGITKSGSDYKTEIVAGLTMFMSVVYALLVVPGMYEIKDAVGNYGFWKVSFNAVFIATALGAVVGTMLMSLLAKMPLAQASGLGATAYVTGTLLGYELGLSYANAMIFVMLDGFIFILLTVTGLRKKILSSIPDEVKIAIPVGIGFYIAFIGFKNTGLVTFSTEGVALSSFNVLGGVDYLSVVGSFIALVGVMAIAVLTHKNVKGSILWGILGCSVIYYAAAGLGCAWGDENCLKFFNGFEMSDPFGAFVDWGKESAGRVFIKGFDFSEYINSHNVGALIVLLLTSALSLCMLDMFDTIGTLYGACAKGNLLDSNGNPLRMNKSMLSDSVATCVGSVLGATTVTTYVESSAGIAAGGKTGFTALITSLCFIVAMFLSPIAKLIPSCATGAALIWVGVLMMGSVAKIDWSKPIIALPAFLTVAVMAFGFSISKGIGVGIISCIICKLCTGKIKEISPVMWVIAVLFLLMFLLTN